MISPKAKHRQTPADSKAIAFPPLVHGVLVKRYKRFLADVRLDDGQIVTAHCPNSGRMTGCAEPERTVYLSRQDRPGRKLPWSWELIDMPDSLVGVNTLLPNRLVAASAMAGCIAELSGYDTVQREVRVGDHTRLDLVFTGSNRRDCYVEIKNCTWVENGAARFPDAPTTRGQKHLAVLTDLIADGHRAVIFYVIQRMDARIFEPAADVDPAYARGLADAVTGGVEVVAYDTRLSPEAIQIRHPLPWRLSSDPGV